MTVINSGTAPVWFRFPAAMTLKVILVMLARKSIYAPLLTKTGVINRITVYTNHRIEGNATSECHIR